jgi:hypothetical protein
MLILLLQEQSFVNTFEASKAKNLRFFFGGTSLNRDFSAPTSGTIQKGAWIRFLQLPDLLGQIAQ